MDEPARIGILTVSDGVHAGERSDRSGDLISEWVGEMGHVETAREVVPDESNRVVRALIRLVDREACEVVVTTGGTGFGERDVTPEATRSVLDREAPGVAERIRSAGWEETAYAALSRGTAGIRGRCLIVNLPGSPSGVEDGLAILARIVDHAVEILRGSPTEHD